MLTDGRVPAVSERAALAAAQAGEVVLVAAEVLRDGPAGRYAFLGQLETIARGAGDSDALDLVRAVLPVDDVPARQLCGVSGSVVGAPSGRRRTR